MSVQPEPNRGADGAPVAVAQLRRSLAHARQDAKQLRIELIRAREALQLARLKLEQTESALANLSMLFTSAAVPIVVCDLDAHIVDLNPEAERRFGIRRRDVLGERLHILVDADRRGLLDGLLQRCRTDETVRQIAELLWPGESAQKHERTTLSPLHDANGDVAGIVLAEDLRELVASTKLLEEVNRGLQEQLFADSLTQVGNRRLFERDLERETGLAIRAAEPVSLLMIDVDHFKTYNDAFGHVAGDVCLRAVGRAIATTLLRPTDSVARYGGEEFVVLLPRTNPAGAKDVAERIRATIEGLHGIAAELRRPITVSVGVATAAGAPGLRGEALLLAADRGMYAAKDGGRNGICVGELDGVASQ